MESDRRPKRTSLKQMPCLADPSLQCVEGCEMFDLSTRLDTLKEIDLDLPPVKEVYDHHVNPKDITQDAQSSEEQIYHEERRKLQARYCVYNQE